MINQSDRSIMRLQHVSIIKQENYSLTKGARPSVFPSFIDNYALLNDT